ncbi:cell surface protein [Streptomyces sp. NPDC090022]|uniref:cell surface protein n=1 Tax=Streptomyces sp. NPDC090022 TaxID=3365920 RepID=UPI00381E1A67
MTWNDTTADLVARGIDAAFSIPDSGGSRAAVFMVRGGWAVQYDAASVAPPTRGTALRELWPKLPAAYLNGFDAACSTDTARVYLFKGATCVLYDMERNEPVGGSGPVPIGDKFPGLRKDAPEFADGVDAGLPAPDGTVHLFRGSRCVNYDIEYDEVVVQGPIADIWRNPAYPDSEVYGGVAAAFSHPATSNGYLLTTDGKRYVECDTDRHRVTSGTELLRDRWPYRTFLGVVDSTEELLRVFDADTGQQIRQASIGRSQNVSFSQDGFLALAPTYQSGQLALVDVTAGTLQTVPAGSNAFGLGVLPDGSAAYVGSLDGPDIRVIDLATGASVPVDVGSDTTALLPSPDGRHVHVTCRSTDDVAVVDTATRQVVRRADGGFRPTEAAITPDGSVLGLVNRTSGSSFVALVNAAGGGGPRLVEVGRDLSCVAPSPDSQLFYAADLGPDVRVIHIATASVVDSVRVEGERPNSVVVSPDGAYLFVVGYRGSSVKKMSLSGGEEVASFPLGAQLFEYAYLGIGPAWG